MPPPTVERVERDELAVVVLDQVGGQAGALAVGLGDEGGQLGRAVLAPAADDDLAPALAARSRAAQARSSSRSARTRSSAWGASSSRRLPNGSST